MISIYNHKRKIAFSVYKEPTKRCFLFILFFCVLLSSCKKILEVDQPIDKITATDVYSNTNTAAMALSGVYAKLANNSILSGRPGLSFIGGLLADELVPGHPNILPQVYQNTENSADGTSELWINSYREIIYSLNSLIKGVSASDAVPNASKEILIGEAKFTRALVYFYLVNLYGDVPLVLSTDFQVNVEIPRADKGKVYEQIVKDLTEAQALLKDQYLGIDLSTAVISRIRPNKAAATALLARVYLYLGSNGDATAWSKAENEASKVIGASSTYELVDLNNVFLKDSKEAIWQLQPDQLTDPQQINTRDGRQFIPFRNPATDMYNNPSFIVSNFLLSEFEAGDNRRSSWINDIPVGSSTTTHPIPFKYKVGTNTGNPEVSQEYTMVLRLAEQYLIRAEARALQGRILGVNSAQDDLNAIRSRAGLAGTTATTQTEMLDAIDHERYVELFTELGHRWLDLKRRGKIDTRMETVTPVKGGSWASFKALLPIPYDEFKYNPSLIGHQNPGYREF